MGLILIDLRPIKNNIIMTINNHRYKKISTLQAIEQLNKDVGKFKFKSKTHMLLENHISSLININNHDRAIKIVNVISDYDIRLWFKIPILIIFWPFRFIYKIIRMGF